MFKKKISYFLRAKQNQNIGSYLYLDLSYSSTSLFRKVELNRVEKRLDEKMA